MKVLDHAAAVEVLAREDHGRGYGRLGCFSPSKDEVYVVPVSYRFEGDSAYFACLPGQTIEYLRAHPTGVCLEVDDIDDESDWVSVIATGHFEELFGREYQAERQLASSRALDGPLRDRFKERPSQARSDLILCALRIERISGRRDQWDWDVVMSSPEVES